MDLLEVKETFPEEREREGEEKSNWARIRGRVCQITLPSRCVFFQPPKTAFDDYMDYRMNRVHRGAMVRSILNQVELDPKPTRYRPLPITSIKYGLMNPSAVVFRLL